MIKTGIWQIIEMLTIILSLFDTLKKHGKYMLTQKSYEEYNDHTDSVKLMSKSILFIFYIVFGPTIAWLGGCRGIWLMAYISFSFIMFLYGVDMIDSERVLSKKHNFFYTFGVYSIYTYILYLGGFWTTP